MVPTKCPVTRAFVSYISLLFNYISIINIKESTSYFPNNHYLEINYNKYLEIQAHGLTLGLTPYDENETPSTGHPKQVLGRTLKVSDSRTLDSYWGN